MREVVVVMSVVLLSCASAYAGNSHREATRELLQLMDVKSNMIGGTEAMADAMISQNPMLAPYRSVILEWAAKNFAWENFEEKFVDIYVEAFSEEEIGDLAAFYATPTGRKAIRLQPEMMKKGAMLGAQVGAEHAQELDAMIRTRAAELE